VGGAALGVIATVAVVATALNGPSSPSAVGSTTGPTVSGSITGTPSAGGPGPGSAVAPTAGPPRSGAPAHRGDSTHPGDGTWGVGATPANVVVASGTYETTVPANSAGCTYLRIALNHTIITTTHARAGQHVTVTIAATDGLFNTHGCGEWTRVS
jgi:hypothetical protein